MKALWCYLSSIQLIIRKKRCSVLSVVTDHRMKSLCLTQDHFRVISYKATSRQQSCFKRNWSSLSIFNLVVTFIDGLLYIVLLSFYKSRLKLSVKSWCKGVKTGTTGWPASSYTTVTMVSGGKLTQRVVTINNPM